jgi:hypothetical protein
MSRNKNVFILYMESSLKRLTRTKKGKTRVSKQKNGKTRKQRGG